MNPSDNAAYPNVRITIRKINQTGNSGTQELVVQRQSGRSQCEHGSLYHGINGENSWTPSIQLPEVPAGPSPKYGYKWCLTYECRSMEQKSEDGM